MFCSPRWKLNGSQWVSKEHTCYLCMKTAKPSLWTYFMLHDALEVTCFYSNSLLSAWLPFIYLFIYLFWIFIFLHFFIYFVWNSQIAPGSEITSKVQMVKGDFLFVCLFQRSGFLFLSVASQKCQTFSLTSWHISIICSHFQWNNRLLIYLAD